MTVFHICMCGAGILFLLTQRVDWVDMNKLLNLQAKSIIADISVVTNVGK